MSDLTTAFKESFKDDMRYIYPGPEGVSKIQMRDLVRVYSMGWADSLKHYEHVEEVRAWAEGIGKELAEVGWEPDESWIWWTSLDPHLN